MGMRHVAHEPMDPNEYLQKSNGQRGGHNSPGSPVRRLLYPELDHRLIRMSTMKAPPDSRWSGRAAAIADKDAAHFMKLRRE